MRLVAGGPEAPQHLERGYFVRPTVFSGGNHHTLARQEVFGPVNVMIPFDDEDDAVAIANDSDYGLAGGVWAADPRRPARSGGASARAACASTARPSTCVLRTVGWKLSVVGREMGRCGVEEHREYQSLIS